MSEWMKHKVTLRVDVVVREGRGCTEDDVARYASQCITLINQVGGLSIHGPWIYCDAKVVSASVESSEVLPSRASGPCLPDTTATQ